MCFEIRSTRLSSSPARLMRRIEAVTISVLLPVMTVESYWPYATTLFDYVRRAMPFQAPGLAHCRRSLFGLGFHPGGGQYHRQNNGARRAITSKRADAKPLHPQRTEGALSLNITDLASCDLLADCEA